MRTYSLPTTIKHSFYKFIGLNTDNVMFESNKFLKQMKTILDHRIGIQVEHYEHCINLTIDETIIGQVYLTGIETIDDIVLMD